MLQGMLRSLTCVCLHKLILDVTCNDNVWICDIVTIYLLLMGTNLYSAPAAPMAEGRWRLTCAGCLLQRHAQQRRRARRQLHHLHEQQPGRHGRAGHPDADRFHPGGGRLAGPEPVHEARVGVSPVLRGSRSGGADPGIALVLRNVREVW